MNTNFKLVPKAIASLDARDKAHIFTELSALFARAYELDPKAVFEALDEREKLGSTGFGRGVAIPHARIDGIKRPLVAIMRLERPIEFGSADAMPVDLVFGLLSSSHAGATHLHALAAISRLVRDDETHRALLDAADEEALFAMLTNVTDRDAA